MASSLMEALAESMASVIAAIGDEKLSC